MLHLNSDYRYLMFGKFSRISLIALPFLFVFCKSPNTNLTYNSEDLQLLPVSNNSYVHISNLTLSNGATFPCNGLVYVSKGEALIIDSPTNNKATEKLIDWLAVTNKIRIVGLVVNHFHDDCIGGIEEFHRKGIQSYGHSTTLRLIEDTNKIPQHSFEEMLVIKVGNAEVINSFFGEAHTRDNIVSYFPEEELLFGGCMIKSINATRGNLADANVEEWANTVAKIKAAYPNLKIIIPGHGDSGDTSLLNYTIQLFSSKQ